MRDEQEILRKLNSAINDAENEGNAEFLAGILAPKLAFQRADPQRTVDDRVAFLEKVRPGGQREIRVLDPIEIFGNRAIVQCDVRIGTQHFHNLRLFVRRDGGWKLLGWANEETQTETSQL